jgi:dTDP-4-dehydrorhamnose reductase
MKVLVTGAGGMTGSELVAQAKLRGWESIGFDRASLDITDPVAVNDVFSRNAPDVVINAAAYTAVDAAESDVEGAMEVNARAAGNLARAAQAVNAAMIHISTDYVFDGAKGQPYLPDDPTHPLGVYGESKLAGEIEVREACERHAIVRSSWVFSHTGKNFVRTMLGAASAGKELRVVDDQHGSPTSAHDLAAALLHVGEALHSKRDVAGTYHFTNSGTTTWFGFAKAIFDAAGVEAVVQPCSTAHYPTPARRPVWSSLDCTSFTDTFGFTPRPWREALTETISRIHD